MRRNGFTLVELLVVIAIIAMLVTLLLSAVQSAREAARNLECKNKLKQMSLAMLNHVSAHGHIPGDGWGYWWAGDPDRGSGRGQTGAWLYRILPYTEASDLYSMGRDNQPHELTDIQRNGLSQAIQIHLPWFNCPTRRDARLAELRTSPWNYRNVAVTEKTASISYFANYGSNQVDYEGGPDSLGDGPTASPPGANGVIYTGSEVRPKHIEDGLSKTYLVGDMFWNRDPTGERADIENYFGIGTPFAGGYVASGALPPKHDRVQEEVEIGRWGSAHPSTWNVAFCDGSVHAAAFDVDLDTHRRLSSRRDGNVVAGP